MKNGICAHNLISLNKDPKYLIEGIKRSSIKSIPPRYDNVSIVCHSDDELLEQISKLEKFRAFEITKELGGHENLLQLSQQHIANKKKKEAEAEIERLKKEHNIS